MYLIDFFFFSFECFTLVKTEKIILKIVKTNKIYRRKTIIQNKKNQFISLIYSVDPINKTRVVLNYKLNKPQKLH